MHSIHILMIFKRCFIYKRRIVSTNITLSSNSNIKTYKWKMPKQRFFNLGLLLQFSMYPIYGTSRYHSNWYYRYTCICTYMYKYIYMYVYVYVCTCMYMCMCAHVYIYTYIHTHIYIYTNIHVHIYVYILGGIE